MTRSAIIAIIACVLLAISTVYAHDGHDDSITPHIIARSQDFHKWCGVRQSSCVLQEEVTQGPYYINTAYVRQNITAGQAGIALILKINVVNVDTCEPIDNAYVDIWHANHMGVYSHYEVSGNEGGENTTFLRGLQPTDENGLATIYTIFPGHYTGRATHIHMKVHIDDSTTADVVHTGQMFFNDSVVDTMYAYAPYTEDTASLTYLSADNIYAQAGTIAIMDLEYIDATQEWSGGVIGYLTVGVNVSYTSSGSGSSQSSSPTAPPSSAQSSSPPSSLSTTSASSSTTAASTTTTTASSTSQASASTTSTSSSPMMVPLLGLTVIATFLF